jgi:two-component system response regulator RegA
MLQRAVAGRSAHLLEEFQKPLLIIGFRGTLGAQLLSGLSEAGFVPSIHSDDVIAVATMGVRHILLAQGPELSATLATIRLLRERAPGVTIVVASAYACVPAAVACMKAGASDYLAKPLSLPLLLSALGVACHEKAKDLDLPSPDRVRWDYIQQVYAMTGHNISETARRLSMHRRTLQRMLSKRAPV